MGYTTAEYQRIFDEEGHGALLRTMPENEISRYISLAVRTSLGMQSDFSFVGTRLNKFGGSFPCLTKTRLFFDRFRMARKTVTCLTPLLASEHHF